MASETTAGSNIEIVREYTERVFNQHRPDLAAKYLAPGVTWHGQTLGTIEGADNVTGMLRGFIGALPDLHAAEQDIVAAGDTVAVRYIIEATHEGNLLGIAPTGRRVRWDAVDIYRLAGGMIVEEWAADDATAILYQAGAYTPPWLATSRPTDADGAGRSGSRWPARAKPAAVSLQPARHRSASPTSPPRPLRRGSRRGIVKAPIANLADFAALDPFFRIIEQGLDGLAGPGHFFDILAEDITVDYVVTVPGYPRHIEGRAAVAELYRPYGTMIILDRCFDLAVHHDATKGVVVLEYASEGHVAGIGRRYSNRYISVLTLREGEVAHWRDYLDPVAVFDALGWPPR